MNNKSLFWYGFFGNMKKRIGKILIAVGIVFGLFYMAFNVATGIFIMALFCIIGGILIAKGSSQRFDYQRQSGQIIHGGDNFR